MFQHPHVRARVSEADIPEFHFIVDVVPFLHRQRPVVHVVRQIQELVHLFQVLVVFPQTGQFADQFADSMNEALHRPSVEDKIADSEHSQESFSRRNQEYRQVGDQSL